MTDDRPQLPLVHSNPTDTEVAALAKVASSIQPMREHIVEVMIVAGEHGLTSHEYAEQHEVLITTARRRFVDLWKGGEIRPTDRSRTNAQDNEVTVYVVGADPEGVIEQQSKPSPEEINQALDEIVALLGGAEASPELRKLGKWLRYKARAI